MNGKQRLQAVCRGNQPDRPPVYEQSIYSHIATEVLGRKCEIGGGGIKRNEVAAWIKGEKAHEDYVARMLRDLVDTVKAIGLDIIRLPWRERRRPTRQIDENTFLFGVEDSEDFEVMRYDPASDTWYHLDSALKRHGMGLLEKQLTAALKAPPPTTASDPGWAELDFLIREVGTTHGIALSAAGVGIPMTDPEWLEIIMLRSELVRDYLLRQADQALLDLRAAKARGVDIIMGGGDLADNKGPVFSPRLFRKVVLPQLQKVTTACADLMMPYVYRTDGNIWPIADMMFTEGGAQGYGEIDLNAGMRILDFKKKFPKLICWGNVDCGRLMSFGTPEEVRAATLALIEEIRPFGRHILGSSNSIHQGIPTPNFLAMVEAAKASARPLQRTSA
ncbi:MAG TPA: uroporphyrinogen decarboxylase family protein [Planctomycetota bacterium]|nr:uroporphyrinogen decarboxylase family protein [Planctomycetota bacterium]